MFAIRDVFQWTLFFRCEIYKSQMIVKLCTTEQFQISHFQWFLINIIDILYERPPVNVQILQAAGITYISKNLQH